MLTDNLKKTILIILIAFLSVSALSSLNNFNVYIRPTFAQETTMYIEPQTITDLEIGETFNITVLIKDFTDLYGYQVGIHWNASLLEATHVLIGKVYWPESIFAILAPTRNTNLYPGSVDNDNGQIYPPYAETLTGTGGVSGTPGVGYNLMKVTFRVKGYAPEGSYINLTKADPYGPISCWTQYPNVTELLTPVLLNATFSTVEPMAPSSPVANFTWTPTEPVPFQNITFDASSSLSGFDGSAVCPITEYRWDFDGDLVFDLNTSASTVKYSYNGSYSYPVTLEVYAPGSYPPEVPDTNRITKTVTVVPPPPAPISPTLIYVDPPYINATTVGETINVTIKIQDFIQLWSWQVGLKWDPEILNCTSVTFGPELEDGVFNVLAPGRYTLPYGGDIDNVEGKIIPAAESLTIPGEGVTAVAGVSYNLMKLTFEVLASGISDLHMYEVTTLYYPDATEGQTIIRDTYTIRLAEGDFVVQILTNSTGLYSDISGHTFAGPPQNLLTLNITARSYRLRQADSENGFANITIPKALMWVDILDEWAVLINGEQPLLRHFEENDTHYFLHFVYPHRTNGDPETAYPHIITIQSTYAIPELSQNLLLISMLIVTAIALLYARKLKGCGKRQCLHG